MSLAKIGNKIFNKEVELSKEEIELGVASELKTLTNALKSQLSIDDRVLPESQKLWSTLSTAIPKAKDRFKTNESVIKATDGKIDLAEDAIQKAEKAAKELGVNPNEISNFKEVNSLLKEVKQSKKMVVSITDRLKNVVK